MSNIIKNTTIIIPDEWHKRIDEFVKESLHSHRSLGRDYQTMHNNIRLGKIGEVALYLICVKLGYDISEPNFINSPYGDGGKDFICCNKLTDVKTSLFKTSNYRVMLGSANNAGNYILKSDVYIAFQYDENNKTAIYLGGISKETLIKDNLLRYDINGNGYKYFYFEISHLKDLDENLHECVEVDNNISAISLF